jgi:hypothetical protein
MLRNVIQQASKAVRLRNLGQRGRNMLAKAGESDRAIRVKMVRSVLSHFFFLVSVYRDLRPSFLWCVVDSM